jgi:hypothetical protein
VTGREGPGPERPGPDYPPEWDREPDDDLVAEAEEGDVCELCGLVPREGEQHRAVYAVGQTGEDAEEVCVGADRRQLDYAPIEGVEPAPYVVASDPWATQGPVPPPPF